MTENGETSSVKDKAAQIKQELELISNSPTVLEEEKVGEYPDRYSLTVSLPYNCVINGILTFQNQDTNDSVLYINMFQVPDDYRGKGVGQRLMRSLVAKAKKYGATQVSGNVTSESSVRTRARVFGVDNLVFFQRGALGMRGDAMPVSYEQVIEKFQKPDFSCFVDVDLRQVDTNNWELPTLEENK